MKYENTDIVFQEIPDETTLAINITNCPCHCPGCHSKYLWNDIGQPLTTQTIDQFINTYGASITCISFMGGDSNPDEIDKLAAYVHQTYPHTKVAWYSGRSQLSSLVNTDNLDYYKIGPYLQHLGPLKSPTTNQRIYRKEADGSWTDITNRMQTNGIKP